MPVRGSGSIQPSTWKERGDGEEGRHHRSRPRDPASVWRFNLPLPVAGLSPNAGGRGRNRWAEARARREYRDECVAWLLSQHRPLSPLAYAVVEITACVCRRRVRRDSPLLAHDRYRPRDEPNLSYALKPLYDALQDAGILEGDDRRHMRAEQPRIVEVFRHEYEGVEVVVIECAPEGSESLGSER